MLKHGRLISLAVGIACALFGAYILLTDAEFISALNAEFHKTADEDSWKSSTKRNLVVGVMSLLLGFASFKTAYLFFVDRFRNKWVFASTDSSDEKLLDYNSDRLLDIKRQLEKERDEEIVKRLRAEEVKYQELIEQTQRSSFWSADGSLNIEWKHAIAAARERLAKEERRLSARSSSSLRNGIMVASIGVISIFVMFFIFAPTVTETTWSQVAIAYLPRALVALYIQLIATFYFRLYVSTESDIKQNKNEMTNLELRMAAGLLVGDDRKSLRDIGMMLARDERNFIVKKDEKLAGEVWKTEIKDLQDTVAQLIAKLPNGGGK